MTGTSLRSWRDRRGLSQRALAEQLGWARGSLAAYEVAPDKAIPRYIALALAALDYGLPPMR